MSLLSLHPRSRAGTKVCAVFVALLGLAAAACSAQLDDAVAAHRAGKYSEAISIYRRALSADANSLAARKGLARALSDTGEYADAEQTLRAASAAQEAAVAVALGDVLALQGKLSDAEAAYRRGLRSQDSLSARVNLAVMQYRKGEHAAALDEFDRFIDVYNGAKTRLRSEDLAAVGLAVQYLGKRDPQLFKDALLAYDQAAAADPSNMDVKNLIGELFLEKYQAAEAEKAFQEVLAKNPKNPRALIGLARSKEFDGSAESLDLAKQALEVNPRLLDAQQLLGRNSLGVEDATTARAAIDAALKVNPSSLEALTLLAAAQYFAGEKSQHDATVGRIKALNPRYSDLYTTLADISVQTRRYAQAVELARQAIALDSMDWKAHGIVGINLMRLGSVKEGRASLEVAFKGDPYNVWFKNTLDLLDTMGKFRETEIGRFQIAVSAREADLLTPYVAELAEDAYQKLSARYKTQLTGPIRIELFNSHADFSVRTVGLAGLGALGASFGNVLVMDSPSAREAGHFNWGTTLWHEMAHAFHLSMSDHRVPRWLTEGLAVLEERKARPGWGDDLGPGYLIAFKGKKLLPVSEMNRGFVRPAYPEQVMHSYFQASLVSQMIEEQYGFDAILNLLKAYKNGQSTEQAFPSVLKTDLKAFDRKYETWFEQKYARQIAAVRVTDREKGLGSDPNDFATQLGEADDLIDKKEYDKAIAILEKAKAAFPEYAGEGSPYAQLARIYREKGDKQKAAAELEQLTLRNETNYEANVQLADLLESVGNSAGAAAALERGVFIFPMQPALHTRLAGLYGTLANKAKVVRERRALVALNPVDRAEALYQLALAYFELGDRAAARREVLRALEEAPNFEKAQELLLRLRT